MDQFLPKKGLPYALMKNAKGEYVLGWGKLTSLAVCPADQVAFYVNDFGLSASHPWKVFEHIEHFSSFPRFSCEQVKCSWQRVSPEGFTSVFSELSSAIQCGDIRKSVPVVTERGQVQQGSPEELIFSTSPVDYYQAYAWSDGKEGFCGLTPETLFSAQGNQLKTMALAGTAHVSEKDVFAIDEKEIQEHAFVAQTLIKKFDALGKVQATSRRMMELDSLVHFYTPIEVYLHHTLSVEDLMHHLHPTPALGPLPKNTQTMAALHQWRKQLKCPPFFGAPMGIFDAGEFHAVVCIRGLCWQKDQLYLPAGCGVIEPSRLTNEWRELQLKRASVKALFSL